MKKISNRGTSKKIHEYLKNNVGYTFKSKDLMKILNINDNKPSVYAKLFHMKKLGLIETVIVDGTNHYRVNKSILTNPRKIEKGSKQKPKPKPIKEQEQEQEQKQKNTLQTIGSINTVLMDTLNSPPLDIAGLMHNVTQIDQQNKIYRNILEQIALLLEQAQIFERIK